MGPRIERALQARSSGRRVEVIDAAVPGYNTAMEAATFVAKGAGYQPDCVLVFFCGNDLSLPHLMLTSVQPKWHGSYLLGAIGDLTEPPPQQGWFRVAEGPGMMSVASGDGLDVPDAYRHMVGFEGYRRALTLLANSAKGVPVVDIADYSDFTLQSIASTEKWVGFQRELGIVVPKFDYPPERAYWAAPDDSHPNASGHAVIAERILRALDAEHVCLP